MTMTAPTDPEAADRPRPKPGIEEIIAYVPGKSKVEGVEHPVKLSSNENILGSSPLARAAFVEAGSRLNLYPDGHTAALREAVAERYRLEPERLVFGCGTDEILGRMVQQVYLEPGDNIVQGEYGFGAYGIGARACQAEVRFALEPNLRLDIDEMLALVDARTRLVFVTQPSNPAGTWITSDELRRLHEGLPASVMLVIDGAYAEFCRDPRFSDGLDFARTASNIIVSHTFSKLHGLAGLRIGWAYAPIEAAEAMERIRLPFNTSVPGQAAAIAALADEAFQAQSLALVEQWRPWLTQQLGGLGLEVAPSGANFILVRFPETSGRTAVEAYDALAKRGYIVRAVANYGLPDCLRITIGLEEHNRAVIEILADLFGRSDR
jgi:histidinol-phosphate aminotransferase